MALLPFIYQPVVSWRHLYSIHSYLIEHGLLCRTPYMSYNIKISSINWPFYGSAPLDNVGGISSTYPSQSVDKWYFWISILSASLRKVLLMSQTILKSDNPDLCPQKNLF